MGAVSQRDAEKTHTKTPEAALGSFVSVVLAG